MASNGRRVPFLAAVAAVSSALLCCGRGGGMTAARAPAPAAEQVRIPRVAWSRPLGQPLEGGGVKKPDLPASHLDDGYWQGAPLGGFGAGTFSRSYRGDFVRWHVEAGRHRYEPVP